MAFYGWGTHFLVGQALYGWIYEWIPTFWSGPNEKIRNPFFWEGTRVTNGIYFGIKNHGLLKSPPCLKDCAGGMEVAITISSRAVAITGRHF
jgi:hypothetical protein